MTPKVNELKKILREPTVEFAKTKIVDFDNNEKLNEKVLEKVFNPDVLNNQSKENILARVIILDRLYSTRLNDYETDKPNTKPSIKEVTEIIYGFELDGRFNSCRNTKDVIELVEDFLKCFNGKQNPYSFITKYCSFRLTGLSVPIQDSFVKGLLYYYNECEEYRFRERFKQIEIKDYSFFCKVYYRFVDNYKLDELSTKSIDKFLWMYAKELSREGNNIQIF